MLFGVFILVVTMPCTQSDFLLSLLNKKNKISILELKFKQKRQLWKYKKEKNIEAKNIRKTRMSTSISSERDNKGDKNS